MNKIFRRILSYSPNKAMSIAQFLIFAILGVVFGLLNLALLIPLLRVLFEQEQAQVLTDYPELTLSIDYLVSLFQYYFTRVVAEHGKLKALLFVCAFIISTAFLANVFRYLERLVATRLKVNVVKNLRMHIFDSITNLHIGYF